jgi:hypothetical protein
MKHLCYLAVEMQPKNRQKTPANTGVEWIANEFMMRSIVQKIAALVSSMNKSA